ncbi:aspartate/glutamate racemase family protein [Arenivirga flava]|uniref:Hydantoin racemase n=1 Tax=Arenivirga flava TaxID=1930060 RepID=A0AA37UBT7_9MICO|nr:aspartate/glutamate racemase family protein [Arenivirga flava]GMA27654.1 hydantoin racemase [Arenivirga flava]
MNAVPRVLLVNPNSSPATTARLRALAEAAHPELRFTAIADAEAPRILTGPEALDAAAARMARLDLDQPEFDDVAAVIVCAFGDPGADALRERMRVPVVGIGAASVRAASGLGPWAIATTTPALAQRLSQLAQDHGGAGFLGSVFTTSAAEHLAGDEARTVLELRAAVAEAAARGAVAVVIGGGPLADAAAALHAESADVAIVQPLLAALDEVAAALLAAPAH